MRGAAAGAGRDGSRLDELSDARMERRLAERGGYRLLGATRVGALWQPNDARRVKMASPRGCKPLLRP
jgi:hypothetical protein